MESARFRWLASNTSWLNVPRNSSLPQPQLVSANHIGLAVVGNLLDLALAKITFHLTTIESFRLSREAHDSADLVKRSFPCGLNYEKTSHGSIASAVYH